MEERPWLNLPHFPESEAQTPPAGSAGSPLKGAGLRPKADALCPSGAWCRVAQDTRGSVVIPSSRRSGGARPPPRGGWRLAAGGCTPCGGQAASCTRALAHTSHRCSLFPPPVRRAAPLRRPVYTPSRLRRQPPQGGRSKLRARSPPQAPPWDRRRSPPQAPPSREVAACGRWVFPMKIRKNSAFLKKNPADRDKKWWAILDSDQ